MTSFMNGPQSKYLINCMVLLACDFYIDYNMGVGRQNMRIENSKKKYNQIRTPIGIVSYLQKSVHKEYVDIFLFRI